MLIRFFKEFDLIGCGGDTQPIRLQVGTLSQSDYRCAQGVRVQGMRVQGVCTQGMRVQGMHAQGWWGHSANQITGGDTQPIRLQVCTGGACAGLRTQGWWGHSANQITGGDTQPIRLQVHAGGVCAGDARVQGVHAQGMRA